MIIEVKAFFKTDKGERIMNFFTHVTPVLSGEILTDEDYFINEISEIVNEMMICKLPEKVLAGWAIASYQGNELFTLSFFKITSGLILGIHKSPTLAGVKSITLMPCSLKIFECFIASLALVQS